MRAADGGGAPNGASLICFRDMTFCPFNKDCAGAKDCGRALTAEVEAAAKRWWADISGEPPIAVFASKPSCHVSSKE